jgi:hypothetical protein
VFSLRNAQRRHDGPQCGAIHATSSYGFLLCPELLELGASTGHSPCSFTPQLVNNSRDDTDIASP